MSDRHISFSELKDWYFCPHYHKVVWIDKTVPFPESEHIAFGSAIHATIEKDTNSKFKSDSERQDYFSTQFLNIIKEYSQKFKDNCTMKVIDEMLVQGYSILPLVLPGLKKYFGNFEVIAAEKQLMVPISEFSSEVVSFKGFIDLIVKTEDGKYHILDFKTCSWGWDAQKRSDKMVTYQLTLYKYFFSKSEGIPLENIETHFCLLKRTAKQNTVELFRVTSGNKKVANALSLLSKALYNICKGFKIKNRLNCKKCKLYKTDYCK